FAWIGLDRALLVCGRQCGQTSSAPTIPHLVPTIRENRDRTSVSSALVDTRIGALAFKLGVPTPNTVAKLRDGFSAGRALLSLGNPNRRHGGVGILSSSTRQGIAANPPPPVQSFSRCSTQVLRIPARSG